MKKTGQNKNCLICNKDFYVSGWQINRNIGNYCSKECFFKSRKGKSSWNKGKKRWWYSPGDFKKGIIPWNFKTTGVGYRALHRWVEKHLGKPNKCEFCGVIEYGRKIQWANKSHKYKRELTDWIRLCVNCHAKYDHNYEGITPKSF